MLWAENAARVGQIVEAALWLCGAFLVGAVIIWFIQRRQRRAEIKTDTPTDQLTMFREMYERGELSQAEYDRLYAKLAQEIRGTPAAVPPDRPAAPGPSGNGASGPATDADGRN